MTLKTTIPLLNSMETERILGLRVHKTSMDSALNTIENFIAQRGSPHHVVTADASMAVIARRDPALQAIVDDADLVTPDGSGIVWAAKLLGTPINDKVSGVDLVAQMCRLSAEHGYRIFFLGSAPGIAEKAAENLRIKYPGVQIVGTHDGYFTAVQEPEVLAQIKAAKPDVLFVAFGIPKQEKWITLHKHELDVPVSLGIGGSFDVYSGLVKRAPLWMQRNSLEWLYRLCKNPKKISKVMTLPEFALLALRQRFLGAS